MVLHHKQDNRLLKMSSVSSFLLREKHSETMENIKGWTKEGFDDYFPCNKKNCNPRYVING